MAGRTIKKDDEAGVRIADLGGEYQVQFREYTKSGKPKWIDNELTATFDKEVAKETFEEMRKRRKS